MPYDKDFLSFNGGEIDESLHARVDLEKFQRFLSECKNFTIHPQGGISNRNGLEYINETQNSLFNSRLIPFVSSESDKYILEFGHKKIRVYKSLEKVFFSDVKNFNPNTSYTSKISFDNYIKIHKYAKLPVTSASDTKYLFFTIDSLESFGKDVYIKYYGISTNMSVSYTDYGSYIEINLTMSSAYTSQNTAKYVQTAINNLGGNFQYIKVMQSIDYANDIPTLFLYVTNEKFQTLDNIYYCIKDIGIDTSLNTNYCPLYDTEFWSEISDNNYISEISSDYNHQDLNEIKYIQINDVMYLTHKKYPVKKITKTSPTTFTISDVNFEVLPFMLMNDDESSTITPSASTGNITLTASNDIFNSGHVGSQFLIEYEIKGEKIQGTCDAPSTSSSIKCGDKTTWRLNTSGSWTGNFNLEKSIDNSNWYVVRNFVSQNDTNYITYGENEEFAYYRINILSLSGTLNISLTSDSFLHKGIVKITSVTDSKHANASVIKTLSNTASTYLWAESSWSEYRGYPRCCSLYQDRLCFASTDSEPSTIWMSKTSEYENFDVSVSVLDNDSISIILPDTKMSVINNIFNIGKLVALTSTAEWTIGYSGNSLTPKNISVICEGHNGCNGVTPIVVGNKAIYIQPAGNNLYDIGYSYESDSYTGKILNIYTKHLFKDKLVVSMALQKEPDNIIWIIFNDGTCSAFTYLKEYDIFAFSRIETDGYFESVSTLSGIERDEVWFIIRRKINGQNKRYIERYMPRYLDSEDTPNYLLLDSAKVYYSESDITSVSNLSHLDGKSVKIFGDGFIETAVVSSGSVSFTGSKKVVIGLPYESKIKTLPIDFSANQSTFNKKMRITSLAFRFLNTIGGSVGDDENRLTEIVFRTDEAVNEPTRLFSGIKDLPIRSNFNKLPQIIYSNNNPYPVTILSITPNIDIGG